LEADLIGSLLFWFADGEKFFGELADNVGMLIGNVMEFFVVLIVIVKFYLTIAPANESPAGIAQALTIELGSPSDKREGGILDDCIRL
jgi:hypothetical protein